MLSRVEGMSRAALGEGLRFEGGGFGDFWNRFHRSLTQWLSGRFAPAFVVSAHL